MTADDLLAMEAANYLNSTFHSRQFHAIEWPHGRLHTCLYERTWTPPLESEPVTELRVASYVEGRYTEGPRLLSSRCVVAAHHYERMTDDA
jgi:hypothetical protein